MSRERGETSSVPHADPLVARVSLLTRVAPEAGAAAVLVGSGSTATWHYVIERISAAASAPVTAAAIAASKALT